MNIADIHADIREEGVRQRQSALGEKRREVGLRIEKSDSDFRERERERERRN